jgi:hypothetical protein
VRAARWILSIALVVAAVILSPSTPAAAADGGRVALQAPQILIDTRLDAKKMSLVVGNGLLQILGLDTSQGRMTVRPCGAAPSPTDPFVTLHPGTIATLRLARSEQMCAYADHRIHFQVIRYGTVSAAPEAGRSQYVELASPVLLFSGVLGEPAHEFGRSIGRPAGLPIAATAAVVSISSFGNEAGYVVVTSCGAGIPSSSGPVFPIPATLPATVDLAAVGPESTLCVRGVSGPVDVDVELLGYLTPSGSDAWALPPMYAMAEGSSPEPGLAAINPDRVMDTRNGIGCDVVGSQCYALQGKQPAGEVLHLDVYDYLTPWTTALSVNVTVTGPDTGGFLIVWPCDEPRPDTSNLNFGPGETRANLVVAKFSADATLCFWSTATTHLIADVTGVYDFQYGVPATSVTPRRLLDTRNAIGVPTTTQLNEGGVMTLQVAGRGGVPIGIDAVTMNVTAVAPLADGFVTVWPCDRPQPNASNLNFAPGRTVPNLVTVAVSATGTVCMYSYATTHLLADVAAWYGSGGGSGMVELSPSRVLDTRNGVGAALRRVEPNEVLTLQLRGRGGVRTDANAVAMNMTITNPQSDGFLTVWPCDRPMPNASNLNFRVGDNVANLVTVALSNAGTVCMAANASTDILADVSGFLTAKLTPYPAVVLG